MSAVVAMFRKVRAVVRRKGIRPDDVEDVVQEAFARLAAYTRAHEVRSQEAFLVSTALNIGRDQARRRDRVPGSLTDIDFEAIADGAPLPEEVVRAAERLRRATAGLEQLTPLARRLLLAQRLDGRTSVELAADEGMSVAAVEKQIARAVLFLVKWMDGW